MNVEHILARKGREVRAIGPNASPEDALQRLRQDRIGSLVVSENGTDRSASSPTATSSTPSPITAPRCWARASAAR